MSKRMVGDVQAALLTIAVGFIGWVVVDLASEPNKSVVRFNWSGFLAVMHTQSPPWAVATGLIGLSFGFVLGRIDRKVAPGPADHRPETTPQPRAGCRITRPGPGEHFPLQSVRSPWR